MKAILLIAIFMYVSYLHKKNELDKLQDKLYEVRQEMQDLVNPDKIYERLGIDVLSIFVGSNLLQISDPDQEGLLLPKVAALRQKIADDYGYVIPNIRLMDSVKIEANEFLINVRSSIALRGWVYPGKVMVNADEIDNLNLILDEDYTISFNPISEEQVYWVDENLCINNKIKYTTAEDVIINAMEHVTISYVNEILTISDIPKYINLVKEQFNGTNILEEKILNYLSLEDIKTIFCNLIEEKISIKDIVRVFELMAKYTTQTTNPDILSEKIRQNMGRQICLSLCDSDTEILYVVKYSDEWIDKILLSYCCDEFGEYNITFSEEQKELFIFATTSLLDKLKEELDVQPVVICPAKIRLALYRFLVKYIPTVNVISEEEYCSHKKCYSDIVGYIE